MAYLAVALNHFRAVQSWANAVKAEANLDLTNFELVVKWRNRYYSFFPQFINEIQGNFSHSLGLSADSTGFIGWLPYKPLKWTLSSDKLVFKRFMAMIEENTPRSWLHLSKVDCDYILKRSEGSFGYELAGPFKVEEASSQSMMQHIPSPRGTPFAEEFVKGSNLKVWFWGAKAFYAQFHAYPTVIGNGISTLDQLIRGKLRPLGENFKIGGLDQAAMNSSIVYQGFQPDDVVPDGREIWLDYRYGRRYAASKTSATTDNELYKLHLGLKTAIDRLGIHLANELSQEFSAPVLYSVDGVVNANGKVFWLEMNSNPMFPPDGYPLVFSTVFGVSTADEMVNTHNAAVAA